MMAVVNLSCVTTRPRDCLAGRVTAISGTRRRRDDGTPQYRSTPSRESDYQTRGVLLAWLVVPLGHVAATMGKLAQDSNDAKDAHTSILLLLRES